MERARFTPLPILALLLRVGVGLTLVVAGGGQATDATAAQARPNRRCTSVARSRRS